MSDPILAPLPLLKSGHKQLSWRLELYYISETILRPDGVTDLGICAIRLLPKGM